jgi:hypothetical protein
MQRPQALETYGWARNTFGVVDLGDARRTERAVKMAARLADGPDGCVSTAFQVAKEQQAAYDWLESDRVDVAALVSGVGEAIARQAPSDGYVEVVVDGSSVTLTDTKRCKGFGSIGTATQGARGVKVMTALALDEHGAPLGALDQQMWIREARRRGRSTAKVKQVALTPVAEKETAYWTACISAAGARLRDVDKRMCVVIDREGDSQHILRALVSGEHAFVIRARTDRLTLAEGGDEQRLRSRLARTRPLATTELDVPAGAARKARKARMEVVATTETFILRENYTRRKLGTLTVNLVWTHEVGTTPPGEEPIDWLLMTNLPVDDPRSAAARIATYARRWRIEEVHRAWKSGLCNVERSQLRSVPAAMRWITLTFAVAARAERLKRVARAEPSRPASDELSPAEVRALILLKRREKKRTETIPDDVPDMDTATRWLAHLGGWHVARSAGPPGAIVIGRGLARVVTAAAVLEELGLVDR